MESFYGGLKGDSLNLKKCYVDTLEPNERGFIVKTSAVDNLLNDFKQGAMTTSEVGYGELVLINTNYTRNENNGNLYRRGFDYQAPAEYRLRELTAREASFSQSMIALILNEVWSASPVESEISKVFSKETTKVGTEVYHFLDSAIEEVINFSFSSNFLKNLIQVELTAFQYDKTSHLFYLYRGAGAEYVGRILGPIGETPEVGIEHYDVLEGVTNSPINRITYSAEEVIKDMYPGGTTDEENNIYINWVNVEDADGNVDHCLIGFKLPYFVPVFSTKMREGYLMDEDKGFHSTEHEVLPDGYTKLITETMSKPFHREWTLEIPKGVKGDSLTRLEMEAGDSELYAVYTSYDNYYEGEESEPTKVGDLNLIERVELTDTYLLGDGVNPPLPKGSLIILYTYDKDGPYTYDGIAGWYEVGNARGLDAGNLCLWTDYAFDSAATVDKYIQALNTLGFLPTDIYQLKYMNTRITASSTAGTDAYGTIDASATNPGNVDYTGWGILAIIRDASNNDTDWYSVLYDYAQKKWYKVKFSPNVNEPEKVITAEVENTGLLSTNGYFLKPITIKSIYDTVGTPAAWGV